MSSNNKNGSTTNGTVKYEARLCHVVKRPDFDGYGFNLHAEKGRPGQYIGKVDDGSPAESAGLRQGDRIIEVNGTNITTETHKKVVELIKSVANETKLLVIDPRADGNDLKVAATKTKNGGVDVNDNSKQIDTSEKSSKQQPNQNKHDVNGDEDANNKKNNNVDTSANKMTMTNGDAKKQPQPAVDQIIEDTKTLSVAASPKTAESNGKSVAVASANGSSTKEGLKLNLNMTAAELRAQLAARKKYDPKNDVCDLRKKYEIIQKM